METTTNYKLPQWVKADQIKMDDFNGAFANIDAALKTEADTRAAADGSAAEALSALRQTIDKSKVCRIKYGSYIGNGKNGTENPTVISCDFCPTLLLLSPQPNQLYWAMRGMDKFESENSRQNEMTWGSDSVSWYYTESEVHYTPAGIQFNAEGVVYYYVLLGHDAA